MTRVLIVLSSANRRGAEIQGSELACALRSVGIDVEIVALTSAANGSTPLDVETMGVTPLAPRTLRRLRAAAADRDVVIGYGSKTLPACGLALLGSPARFVYRSIGDPRAWAGGRVHRLRTRLLYRRPERVVTLWDEAQDSIHELYGLAYARSVSIPNARFAATFRPAETKERLAARKSFGVPTGARVAGWIGSMGHEKRVEVAIKAAITQPDLHLIVAGNGVEWDLAEMAASVDPSRIHLVGMLADPRPFYAAIDAIVSTSRTEGMPGVIIEAALSGRPAVATDVGATKGVVGPGGVTLPPDSTPDRIGSATSDVVDRTADLGAAARTHALETFTWDRVLPRWLELIDSMTGDDHARIARSPEPAGRERTAPSETHAP